MESNPYAINNSLKREKEEKQPKKLIYTRDDFIRHQPKFYELPSNFFDIRALFKEPYKPDRASEIQGVNNINNNKGEKLKTRVKGLSKGDEKEMLSDETFMNPSAHARRNSVIYVP